MATKDKAKKATKQRYLAIPYHILNLPDIGLAQKVLLAYIYGFGGKGCWQSNSTIAKVFMVSPRVVSRWISDIRKYLHIKCSKGYYRTLWAKSHPDVQQRSSIDLAKSVQHHAQNCRTQLDKSGIRLRQSCLTINNNITKEINRDTTPLPPMPAGGQAAAVLADREQQMQARIEQFKKNFGLVPQKKRVRMTEQQFQQRKEQMLKSLMAVSK